jgi:hypothetical protein
MGNSDLLFETIFKRKLSPTDNRAYFTQIAAAHPYFSIAQFYLLLQTEKQSADYAKQAAKTAILFNNPYWLQFQLQETLSPTPDLSITPATTNTFSEKPALKEAIPIEIKQDFSTSIPIETQVVEIPKEVALNSAPQSLNEVAIIPANHFNEGNTPLENDEDSEDEALPDQMIAPFQFKLNINTADITEDKITFEPLHTSDYFASLGIKLSGRALNSDKLGKQLKSFTEWLKDMKKLQPDQIPLQSEQADLSIQQLAEASNLETEVETEAMAEVLIQQGKVKKAITVYKKLSLLNPSKSAYFAAKIDQLKEH